MKKYKIIYLDMKNKKRDIVINCDFTKKEARESFDSSDIEIVSIEEILLKPNVT